MGGKRWQYRSYERQKVARQVILEARGGNTGHMRGKRWQYKSYERQEFAIQVI